MEPYNHGSVVGKSKKKNPMSPPRKAAMISDTKLKKKKKGRITYWSSVGVKVPCQYRGNPYNYRKHELERAIKYDLILTIKQ